MTWIDNTLLTSLAKIEVYQCGSCRSYDDPDHWTFETPTFRSCGHASELAAKQAAEHWLVDEACTIVERLTAPSRAKGE